jgi:hypothetical protein
MNELTVDFEPYMFCHCGLATAMYQGISSFYDGYSTKQKCRCHNETLGYIGMYQHMWSIIIRFSCGIL